MKNSTLELDNGEPLEVREIRLSTRAAPTIVFLHEGLGSVSLWRDFPDRVADATGAGVLVYSRHGYGQSSLLVESRKADYMHREAQVVLPELLKRKNIRKPILFGHSDGASIALIHGGCGHPVAGLILEAPHVFVEEISLRGVAAAANTFRTTDLPAKLARHHRDAGKTFWGWHDIWANTAFRDWNIESFLPTIDCPTLLIQGTQDDYGSIAQIEAIGRNVNGRTENLLLADCGHSPHRDQTHAVLERVVGFIRTL